VPNAGGLGSNLPFPTPQRRPIRATVVPLRTANAGHAAVHGNHIELRDRLAMSAEP